MTGFGVDPTKDANGNITSGTSSQDIREITGGLYNQGIISGCRVDVTTGLSYKINNGVLNNWLGGRDHTLMSIDDVTVPTTAGPSSGSRTDYVYAKQNLPTVDGNSNIVYGVMSNRAPTWEGQEFELARFTVPAGMTRTNQATRILSSMNYATPYGASGKYLVRKTYTYNGLVKNNPNPLSGTFTVGTDRLITAYINATVDSDSGAGISASLYCEVHLNGTKVVTFSTGKIDNSWSTTHTWFYPMEVTAGTHTIALKFFENGSTDDIRFRYSAGGFPGIQFTVLDSGVKD